ncbi:sialate:O-sulfotransferase 2-like [Macrobrachium nipponense]|uniref:sialate:O-sulfotransferase 2-like n=1 Tax=Macrobrachium nipponense TaxID=159736 RepID=UPI0030C7DE22
MNPRDMGHSQISVRGLLSLCVVLSLLSLTITLCRFLSSSHPPNSLEKTYRSHVSKPRMEDVIDMNSSSLRIWGDDNQSSPCYTYETRFAKGLRPIWLLSYPGSGNTWMRYLLEGATGIFTGSVYDDKILFEGGYLGELEDVKSGRTLTQKTHDTVSDFSIPTIILIRNPKSALKAYWNFKKGKKTTNPHLALTSLGYFQGPAFRDFVTDNIRLWETLLVNHLLLTQAPTHIVYYEHLKHNTLFEISRLLEFLGLPVSEGRMRCLQSHITGSFKRKGREMKDPFSESENRSFAVAVSSVRRLLRGLGYPEPPLYDDVVEL